MYRNSLTAGLVFMFVLVLASADGSAAVGGSVISAGAVFCAADVNQCPDGSYVSRNPNANCSFNPCPTPHVFCAADVKQCSDGSYVSRNPNDGCEFYACPAATAISANISGNSTTSISLNVGKITDTPVAVSVPIPTVTTVSANAVLSSQTGIINVNATRSGAITPANLSVGSNQNTPIKNIPISAKPAIPIASTNIPVLRSAGENRGSLAVSNVSADYTGNVEIQGLKVIMNTAAGAKQISVMPENAIEASGILDRTTIQNVVLAEKLQKPVYSIKSARQVKLLFFMPVSMESQTDVDAETGKIISVSKPWWSFFAGG